MQLFPVHTMAAGLRTAPRIPPDGVAARIGPLPRWVKYRRPRFSCLCAAWRLVAGQAWRNGLASDGHRVPSGDERRRLGLARGRELLCRKLMERGPLDPGRSEIDIEAETTLTEVAFAAPPPALKLVVRLNLVEADVVGHSAARAALHEERCSRPFLRARSWCVAAT